MVRLVGRHRSPEQPPAGDVGMPQGWQVLEIPCGTLITTVDGPMAPPLPADPPGSPGYHNLVVASPGPVPTTVIAALARLARSLPAQTQQRLRLVAVGDTDLLAVADLAGALRLPLVLAPVEQPPWADLPTQPLPAAVPAALAEPAMTLPPAQPAMTLPPARPPVALPPPVPLPAPSLGSGPTVGEGFTIDSEGRIRLAPAAAGQTRPQPQRNAHAQAAPQARSAPPPTHAAPRVAPGPPPVTGISSVVPAMPATTAQPRPAATLTPRQARRSLIRPSEIQAVAARWREHMSSAADRSQFRTSLGWRYDAAAQYVTRLLSDRPVLRAGADDGLAADLAAVQFFTNGGDQELLAQVRAAALSAPEMPMLSCLVSGLRRLPALVGPVVRGGPADPRELAAYQPGTELAEPGPLLALTDVATPLNGNAEVLIWSTSARQLQGLIDPTAAPAVMFLPATTLRVLGHDGGAELAQILMVEVPPSRRGQPDLARDEKIMDRLRGIARARAAAGPPAQSLPDIGWTERWLAPMPGMGGAM